MIALQPKTHHISDQKSKYLVQLSTLGMKDEYLEKSRFSIEATPLINGIFNQIVLHLFKRIRLDKQV